MHVLAPLIRAYRQFDCSLMPTKGWDIFVQAFALVFLVYWLHLAHGLDDWLGIEGFHLPSTSAAIFAPLPSKAAHSLWWITLVGATLLFFSRTVSWGCFLAGSGLLYSVMCDSASVGALNIHFLFALSVIFWSTFSRSGPNVNQSAWPVYLMRLYLIVVYFGSGWRKVIYGNWSDNPHALFNCITGYYTTNLTRWLYPILPFFGWTILQYLTLAFELGAPLLLLYPPLRKVGIISGCILHLGIALLMKDLFYFSFLIMTFYIPLLIPTYLGEPIEKATTRQYK